MYYRTLVTVILVSDDAEGAAPGLAGGGLLCHEAGGREHTDAAVLELLGLHLAQLRWVGGLEAKGVEAEVARGVVRAELLEEMAGQGRVVEAAVDAVALGDADAKHHREPDAP